MDIINYVPGPRFYRKLTVFILWAFCFVGGVVFIGNIISLFVDGFPSFSINEVSIPLTIKYIPKVLDSYGELFDYKLGKEVEASLGIMALQLAAFKWQWPGLISSSKPFSFSCLFGLLA